MSGSGQYALRMWGGKAGWKYRRQAYRAGKKVASSKWARARRKLTFRRGYNRTGGYYGRYTGDRPELKFHDLDVDDASIAAGGTIAQASCVTIAQGNTESERIGRKLTIRSVNWRFDLSFGINAAISGADTIRIILYLDKQCNGGAAVVTDILESADYQSFNNLSNKSRFRTLMDRNYDMQPLAAGGDGTTNDQGGLAMSDSVYLKVNIPIEYDNSATTGVITSVKTNNIGVLLLSKNGLSTFTSKMRLRYSDV